MKPKPNSTKREKLINSDLLRLVQEFSFLLICVALFCWTFGLMWLLFAEISRFTLPVFMFGAGILIFLLAVYELCSARSRPTPARNRLR